MTQLWFDIIISFIFGVLFILTIEFLYSKLYKKENEILFTKDISTDKITFTSDYQELLTSRLENKSAYDVTFYETYYHILVSTWNVFNVKDWLDKLSNQDYVVSIYIILKNSDGLYTTDPRILLSNEFMVNNQSNPSTISTLISNRLKNLYEMFDSEENGSYYLLIQYSPLKALY